MPTALTKAAEEALAQFRHYDALAVNNRKKASSALERFLEIISYGTDSQAPLGGVPQCVRVWSAWLAQNGPDTRQNITEATGRKFTERGTPHTLRWDDIQDGDSANIPENTIIRFTGAKVNEGRGAQPVVYALWSQRYDVFPKFGVGPSLPDNVADAYGSVAAEGVAPSAEAVQQALTGVIRPPTSAHPIDPDYGEEEPFDFTAEDLTGDGFVATVSDPTEFDHKSWAERVVAERDGLSDEGNSKQ